MVFKIECARGGVGALEEFARLQELPTLAVGHRGIGDALERVDAIDKGSVKTYRAFPMRGPRGGALQVEIEAVEALPHFTRDLLTDGAGVFSGMGHRGEDRAGIRLLESDEFHHGVAADFSMELVEKLLVFERGENRQPLLVRVQIIQRLEIEHELHIHIENARNRFGALDVAAEPETGIGDAA